MRTATLALAAFLSVALLTGCRKDKISDYTGTYTATRSGSPNTFVIVVRHDGERSIAFESDFGTFASPTTITGRFTGGKKNSGSRVSFLYEVVPMPPFYHPNMSETRITGEGEMKARKSFTLNLTLTANDGWSGAAGSLAPEVVQITTQ